MGVDRVEAADKRISFLNKELKLLNKSYMDAETIIDAVFINKRREPIWDEIAFLQKNKVIKDELDRITDEDIEIARNYPIEQIISFNGMGKATAWCHEDKSPSLSHFRKGNNARCFVCNVTYDSIAAAMELWSLTFVEAVKALS